MHYKIIKETKPNLKNYGRYKAVVVHYQTVDTARLCREIQDNCTVETGDRERQGGPCGGVRPTEEHPQLPHPPVARKS